MRWGAAEVLDACDQLAALSAREDGIERVYLSPQHAQAHARVAPWMTQAGMTSWQDAAGNLCGRLEGQAPALPALLLGSHLDTVPLAGRYDGVLGVMVALAVVTRLAPVRETLPFALEVVGFGDEEGTRFGTTLLGSQAMAGRWSPAWWALKDAAGQRLDEAFKAFGLDPNDIARAARSPASLVGYLEVHIEQGPLLETQAQPLGVVTAIAGARRFEVICTGMAGHAGTTPMALRQDALCAASQAVLAIEALAVTHGCVATVGTLSTINGAANVIPGHVRFTVDLRAQQDRQRDAAWQAIARLLCDIESQRKVTFSLRETHRAAAVPCASRLRAAIAAGIQSVVPGQTPPSLVSGAGHDAMAIAHITEIGMLFVRCAGGISHHPDEAVSADDVALAIDALTVAVLTLAEQMRQDVYH